MNDQYEMPIDAPQVCLGVNSYFFPANFSFMTQMKMQISNEKAAPLMLPTLFIVYRNSRPYKSKISFKVYQFEKHE